MIKKLGKILFIFTLMISLLYTGSLVYKETFEKINTNKKNYMTQSPTPDELNTIILNKVKQLQQYAENYKTENNVSTSATELCLEYIRKDRYTGTAWTTFAGDIDQNFVEYVTSKNSTLKFKNETLIDEQTMKEIDFVHMIGTLNAYYKNGSTAALIFSTHYAGWAGDLMTLLEEEVNYKINNNITDIAILTEYVNSRLGTNEQSTFSYHDSLANFDAININSMETLKTDLHTTLVNYYINNNDTTANNSYNRFPNIQAKLGDKVTIKNSAKSLLGNAMAVSLLIPNVKDNITSNDKEILAQAFADYVYQTPYAYMQQNEGTITIGKKANISLIEKHLNNTTINYDNNIAAVTITDSTMTIDALNYGTTPITIVSNDGTVLSTYNLRVNNIAPKITKNLNFNNELTVGTTKEISINAEGTNNRYTWYLTENENEKNTILEVTNEPTITLNPTIDMNDKYLKCGVSNEGNTEVLTSAIQLKVTDPTVKDEETPKDEDENNNNNDQNKDDDTNNNNDQNKDDDTNNNNNQNKDDDTNNNNNENENTNNNDKNDDDNTEDTENEDIKDNENIIPENTKYQFFEGENQKINNTNQVFKIRIDANISLFDKVYINNELVDPINYKVSEGSTIIEFNKEYIKKLKSGEYSLKVTFLDGKTAETNFTIINNVINKINPYTATLYTYKELVLGIGISLIALVSIKLKKKIYN